MQADLARARRIATKADMPLAATVSPPRPYVKRNPINLLPDAQMDPTRRVASHWDKTELDGGSITHYPSGGGPNNCKFNGPLGPDQEGDGRHRVRMLRGPQAGAVVEVGNLAYLDLRWMGVNHPHMNTCEPVPIDEPLCGPILPLNFPSTMREAREIYAKKTGKDGAEVKASKIIEFFREQQKKTTVEVLK